MLSLHSDLKKNDGLELNLILMNVKHAPRGIYFASFLSILTTIPYFTASPIFFLKHTFATVSPTQKETRTIKPNSWSKLIPKHLNGR